jgi:hypothetical protein
MRACLNVHVPRSMNCGRVIRPNLRGSRAYIDSPRHAYYVKGVVYDKALGRAASALVVTGA